MSDLEPGGVGRSDEVPGGVGGSDQVPRRVGGSDEVPGGVGGSDEVPGGVGDGEAGGATSSGTDVPGRPLLEVRDLKTWFATPRGTVRAVDGVSFTLERGRTLGIVGESGSGKTVLARSIMNLLPQRAAIPAGGEVLFEGRSIRGLGVRDMRRLWGRSMAMVFQDPMTSLNPVVKIGRQLTEGLRHHHRMRGREARATAVALLRSVGLPSPERRLAEYPHHLSGGMRQRVTVALALACGPKLLIADEPTTALDVTVQRQILDLLADQQRERYMAMILVTHDLGVVANRTDEIAVMYAGQVVERAPTETLFRRMRHPYTQALMGSIPRLENPSHTPLQAIPGRPPDMVDLPPGCRFAPRCPYAQARCHTEEPPLVEAGEEGHVHRCFYPLGTTPVSLAPPAPRSAAGSGSVSDSVSDSASGSGSVSDSVSDPASGSGSMSDSVSDSTSGSGSMSDSASDSAAGSGSVSDSASGSTSPAGASGAEGHRGGAGGDGTAKSTQEIAG